MKNKRLKILCLQKFTINVGYHTKEIAEGDDYVLMCLEIVNVHIDERHMDENDLGRTGKRNTCAL